MKRLIALGVVLGLTANVCADSFDDLFYAYNVQVAAGVVDGDSVLAALASLEEQPVFSTDFGTLYWVEGDQLLFTDGIDELYVNLEVDEDQFVVFESTEVWGWIGVDVYDNILINVEFQPLDESNFGALRGWREWGEDSTLMAENVQKCHCSNNLGRVCSAEDCRVGEACPRVNFEVTEPPNPPAYICKWYTVWREGSSPWCGSASMSSLAFGPMYILFCKQRARHRRRTPSRR